MCHTFRRHFLPSPNQFHQNHQSSRIQLEGFHSIVPMPIKSHKTNRC